ncbi:MAG: hypothetical protein K1000chlam3_01032 [Chlamydiae bacterium]|nr:hypothetical protein [Chlamydiota bacterium]
MTTVSSIDSMVPVLGEPSTYPINPSLYECVEPQPWKVCPKLFARVQRKPFDSGLHYKTCEVRPDDKEYEFVRRVFEHSKPPGMVIKTVTLVHNPSLSTQFEATLKSMNSRANPPTWKNHPEANLRESVVQRWEMITRLFQPISVENSDNTRKDRLENIKILPLWHGTSQDVCNSICRTGFQFFGKHSFTDPTAQKGAFPSTDPGYFGSGVYFTSSARYAGMYNARFLILSWVSMLEPFPVVNDCPHPQRGSDMKMLEGKAAYQHYTAHYIPVTNTRPDFPGSMEYYPCAKGQTPNWDEFVLFDKAQALPRYIVEISPEGTAPPTLPISIDDVIPAAETAAGLNLMGICRNSECKKHGNEIVLQKGYGDFDIGKEASSFACPCCKKAIDVEDVTEIILEDCKYLLKSNDREGETQRRRNLTGQEKISIKNLAFLKITTEKKS